MDEKMKMKGKIPMSFDISHIKTELSDKEEQYIKDAKENKTDIGIKEKELTKKEILKKSGERKITLKNVLVRKGYFSKQVYLRPDLYNTVIDWVAQEKKKGNRGASFQVLVTDLLDKFFEK